MNLATTGKPKPRADVAEQGTVVLYWSQFIAMRDFLAKGNLYTGMPTIVYIRTYVKPSRLEQALGYALRMSIA